MITRTIPKTSEPVPVLGLGTWRVFDVASERARRPLAAVLDRFMAAGGRLIDTSPMYGRAEEALGELEAHTAGAFLATKVWTRGRAEGIAQMEQSLRLLRRETLDLIQVHNLVDWRTHLATLREWKRDGRVRYAGVTHYQTSAFGELASILRSEEIDFVQLPMSIELPDAEERLLPLAAERGVAVIVNRPFEGGSLMHRVARTALPAWAAEFDCRSWSELFLRWILSHEEVTCVIPATGNVEHLEENIRAANGRVLDERERRRLRELVIAR